MNNTLEQEPIKIKTLLALGLIIFGVRLQIINTFGVPMPYWDDWGIGGILYNHAIQSLTFQDLIRDVNQHRQVFGKLLSLALFKLNHQQWDVFVLMLANSITWTIGGLFLMNIARKHHREINPIPIILVITIIWTYPISLVNTLWGVQSHVYFMTLFAIVGCWYAGEPALSKKWYVGIFCLFAGGLTLAGGSFIGVSVAAVYFLLFLVDSTNRRNHIITFVAAALASLFGAYLILIQAGDSPVGNNFNLLNSLSTFAKTMSWPVRTHIWPFFVLLAPILVVVKQLIQNKFKDSRLVPFILSLYAFIIIIAVAVATARATDGGGPARRYMDFIALAFIASTFALLIIQQKQFRLSTSINQTLILLWLAVVIVAIPYRFETTRYTLDDRAGTLKAQENNVRRFINTGNTDWLTDKPFRHVPFPRPLSLGKHIDRFQQADIMPYQLQKTPRLTHNPDQAPSQWAQSAFVPNGFFLPSKKVLPSDGWFGESTMGSFYAAKGGNAITGSFESNTFEIDRPYVMVPIIGYTGYPNMSLKLVNVLNSNEVLIKPKVRSSRYTEQWREVLVKVKRGYYKLVAEDNNESLWFGFAAPRTVGRLSYFTQWLLSKGHYIWLSGIALLCLIHRRRIVESFSNHSS